MTTLAGSAFEVSEVSRGAAFGDIDNDGDLDIGQCRKAPDTEYATFWVNDGAATFTAGVEVNPGGGAAFVNFGDLDNDGSRRRRAGRPRRPG